MGSDQWLSGGNCSECRREKYCNKQCKENKRNLTRQSVTMAMAVSAGILSKAIEQVSKEV